MDRKTRVCSTFLSLLCNLTITRLVPVPLRRTYRSILRTLRSFLYHVNVANGLPAVAVHMSFSTVPATIVVLSSYPVTVNFAGGSTKFDKFEKSEPVKYFLPRKYIRAYYYINLSDLPIPDISPNNLIKYLP